MAIFLYARPTYLIFYSKRNQLRYFYIYNALHCFSLTFGFEILRIIDFVNKQCVCGSESVLLC